MGRWGKVIEPLCRAIRDDIFKFCEALNFKPTWQQRLLLEAVQRGEKRVSVKSGQGTGKSKVSGVVGLWRLLRNPDSLLVVTAPTMRQCKDVWLAEVRRTVQDADPIIKRVVDVTMSAIKVAGLETWRAELVTSTKPENAQGKHNPHLTVIAEEASGIPRNIIETFEGTLTNDDALFLMIGNPNTRDCGFFDCFNSHRHRWEAITFNSEESPIVSKENIEYLKEKYGEESDVYRIRVKGEFPLNDPSCVISAEQLEVVTKTDMLEMSKILRGNKPARQFGIDFARFGADETVIFQRLGNAIINWKVMHKVEPDVAVNYAFRLEHESAWKSEDTWYVPDAGGMGQGIMHKFHNANKNVLEFHNNHKSGKEYDNRVTEAWFAFANLVKSGKCKIPRDPRLLQQLSTRQYYTTAKGKLILEAKDDYKKRMAGAVDEGASSPDRADALVLAFYDRVVAQTQVSA